MVQYNQPLVTVTTTFLFASTMDTEDSSSTAATVSSLSSAVDSLGLEEAAHNDATGLQLTSFTELVDDVTLHFQILRLPKQIYAWIGCNSAKLGHLYAAVPTPPQSHSVCATSVLGNTSENTGLGIARRLVLKTGLSIILACNIPKNGPMLEATAEKKLMEKLISLGYTRPKQRR